MKGAWNFRQRWILIWLVRGAITPNHHEKDEKDDDDDANREARWRRKEVLLLQMLRKNSHDLRDAQKEGEDDEMRKFLIFFLCVSFVMKKLKKFLVIESWDELIWGWIVRGESAEERWVRALWIAICWGSEKRIETNIKRQQLVTHALYGIKHSSDTDRLS